MSEDIQTVGRGPSTHWVLGQDIFLSETDGVRGGYHKDGFRDLKGYLVAKPPRQINKEVQS